MAPDKLTPSDQRVQHGTAALNGKTYHYLHGKPEGEHTGTVLLIHGFPDLSFGWRYQIPYLLSLGLQVIAPDLPGFGRSDAPAALEQYGFKTLSADMAALAAQLAPGEQVILGGHDWGGFAVWRIALWQPALVRAVFSVCTPYAPPLPVYVDVDALAARLPNFGYQRQFAGDDIVARIASPQRIRQFLTALQGGRTPAGEPGFSTAEGVLYDRVDALRPARVMSGEEMDYYVAEYARNGMRGPTNWYRTRKVNYDDEVELLKEGPPRIRVPSMIVLAENDPAIPPALANGMEKHFDDLTKRTVPGSHWVLWSHPEQVNAEIGEFVKKVLAAGDPKASL
ncbi:uncharacterized protein E0L32_008251 [Thyridium curvatum]|uniref:AB hydrolase-1 domain-containing protein n=1 Tax=Thyridium curvatum TaxID=1093900 RepID=A0A507AM50_9PEZI|nr:uncharacterized protein E0L32_008251 [Thyridium curvatum]TPX10862.1 hypothetical protein E0L32_008251 [Thyridium curvatum]